MKQHRELTYEGLSFHLEDSQSFRAFARLGMGQYPSGSTLQENIKALKEATWEQVNRLITGYAKAEGFEKGNKVRIDSTGVESAIHYPTDATLFSDHNREIKRRVLKIKNTQKPEERKQAYKDLLQIAATVRGYALAAISALESYPAIFTAHLLEELKRALVLLDRIIDQTRRRELQGEKVPAGEKVVSFFEDHTDIIEKGQRESGRHGFVYSFAEKTQEPI